MEQLVAFLFAPFLRHPDDLRISSVENTSSVLLEIRAHRDDLTSLRGPDGVNLRAVQQVLSAAGGARKPVIELVDGEQGEDEE